MAAQSPDTLPHRFQVLSSYSILQLPVHQLHIAPMYFVDHSKVLGALWADA